MFASQANTLIAIILSETNPCDSCDLCSAYHATYPFQLPFVLLNPSFLKDVPLQMSSAPSPQLPMMDCSQVMYVYQYIALQIPPGYKLVGR